ncbi:class I SAM-dependent methyltransferase [Anabaena sp. FACHB-1237]|uniref:class I SAM-dependent methyltransferase n=1 Tax=Anabaena sp. FACHB-1237 TaxID=2692769 RepID=UPI0016808DD3|nr:class I SAM-dependent methyltransferase [Anabaena sp. FACHB-1237]MBD2137052.1 class I SAM-dependent methyltransferase [Anabaena sp. FACHB-1237]
MINNFINNKKELFDRWANSYDWTFPSFIYQAIHKILLTKVELSPHANILDLGCGTGRLLDRLANYFPGITATGLDLSPQMLRIARINNRHHPRLIYLEGNAENLPFAQGQFDAVFNTISFLHYAHPEQVLSEVKRVLSPGGRFYLVDISFNNSSGCGIRSYSPTGVRFYSQKEREEMGKNVGLTCLEHHHLLGFVLLTIFENKLPVR